MIADVHGVVILRVESIEYVEGIDKAVPVAHGKAKECLGQPVLQPASDMVDVIAAGVKVKGAHPVQVGLNEPDTKPVCRQAISFHRPEIGKQGIGTGVYTEPVNPYEAVAFEIITFCLLVCHHGVGVRLNDTPYRLPHYTGVHPIGRGT